VYLGYPEVYIVALPAFGMTSGVIPIFSREGIYGCEFVAASTLAIAVLSLLVWAHHMFAVGLGHSIDGCLRDTKHALCCDPRE
jgi:heme/copper-type cytochrome/quinol oxidase subunit 1